MALIPFTYAVSDASTQMENKFCLAAAACRASIVNHVQRKITCKIKRKAFLVEIENAVPQRAFMPSTVRQLIISDLVLQ